MSQSQSWMKPSAHVVILTFMGLVCSLLYLANTTNKTPTISPRQLIRLVANKNVFLINVHTSYVGEIEHTDTFINPSSLEVTSKLLPQNLDQPIIVYDQDDGVAPRATQALLDMGFSNVRYLSGGMRAWQKNGNKLLDLSMLEATVLPKEGIELPILWGTLGKQLVDIGVIDLDAFQKAVPLTTEQKQILTHGSTERIKITTQNSQFVVDVLWALGLAQKSKVFTDGPMGKEEKDEVRNLASTGGWNLARGLAIDYLNAYELIPLTESQQDQVADIAHHVYRPCCNNSVWFPDCNHGMAALAIIELLVSQHVDESTIYKKLLGFNSFWFPDSYLTIAAYFARMGVPWSLVDAKEVLGFPYSSGTGAQKISSIVGPLPFTTNFIGGCGV